MFIYKNCKVYLAVITFFFLIGFHSQLLSQDDKIIYSGKGINITYNDIKAKQKTVHKELVVTTEEVEKVVLMDKLFAQEAKANLKKSDELNKELELVIDEFWSKKYKEILSSKLNLKQEDQEDIAKSYYAANPEMFTIPSQYKVSTITTFDKDIAYSVKSKLGLKPLEKFSELALQYSTDEGVKINKGNIGWIPFNRMPAEYQQAILKCKQGEVCDPFFFENKWVILMITDYKKAYLVSFEEVKQSIATNLMTKEYQEKMNSELESLKTKYQIKKIN